MWKKDNKKSAFGKVSWGKILIQPKFANKVVQFKKSHKLINQFKSITLD